MPKGGTRRKTRTAAKIFAAASMAGFLAGAGIVPCAGYEVASGRRITPNLLIVLNRSASMATPIADGVSDLDGDGIPSRYDLALAVLFRILNADGGRIGGLATPVTAADVPRFRSLITVEDELFLSARVGILWHDGQAPREFAPEYPFQIVSPPETPNRPPFGKWAYRALWDNVYSLRSSRPLSPPGGATRFPKREIASYFAYAGSRPAADPLVLCRPREVILITDGSDMKGLDRDAVVPEGIDRFFALFVGVSSEKEQNRFRRLFGETNASRVVFFHHPADVDGSGVFDEIAAPISQGPWKTADPVVPLLRTRDSNRLFAASLVQGPGRLSMPGTGRLRPFALTPDGSPLDAGDRVWDAAAKLATLPPAARKIFTSEDGGRKVFRFDPILGADPSFPGESGTPDAALFVDFLRNTPLGGLTGSTPVLVGRPSTYYADPDDPAARQAFVERHFRRPRILLAAANDGMLHAFDAGSWDPHGDPAGYGAGTGEEKWAFLPGFLVRRREDPSGFSITQKGYAEGSTAVADLFVGKGNASSGGTGGAEWRTYAFGGAGMGGKGYFALDITDPKSIDYPALVWERSKAEIPLLGRAWSTPAIGKVRTADGGGVDRERRRGRWVAVVGAGKGSPSGAAPLRGTVDLRTREADLRIVPVENTGNAPDSGQITLSFDRLEKQGKSWVSRRYKATGSYLAKDEKTFHDVVFRNRPDRTVFPPATTLVSWTDPGEEGKAVLVLDASTGEVLQTLTHPDMGEVVAPPAIVIDAEGFIERVYVGDLEGNVWKATVNARGAFDLGKRPFFSITGEGYAKEINMKIAVFAGEGAFPVLWIVFGTGNPEDPMEGSRGAVFAVYDDPPFDRSEATILTEKNLADATAFFRRIDEQDLSFPAPGKNTRGWYGAFPGIGEKMLGPPRVFHHNLYFATFRPGFGTCPPGGTGRLYGFGSVPGRNLGEPALPAEPGPEFSVMPGRKKGRMREFPSGGILSGPVISIGPAGAATLYAGFEDGTVRAFRIPAPGSRKSIRYWQDAFR